MKRILLINILFLVKISMVIAQPKSGEYKQNPEIDKFVGTWEWVSGNEKFQIVIGKQKVDASHGIIKNYYNDTAIGWLSYTKAGVVIESTMDKANTQWTTTLDAIKNSSMVGGSTSANATLIRMVFKDYGKKKSGRVKLELLSGKTNEARWTLESVYAGDIRIVDPNDPPEPEGFSVPIDVVMKKVK